ncbi:MAG: hypothetical protein CM1200mP2_58670 [Planctomycetaceae bacterium]|nr:MAG: hypothetical protein CM1200mP2_58670 [Planctomycetaceae bacterium]
MGPHSGNPSVQGSVQKGKSAHLFAPMGFLDAPISIGYWVFGRSFAGGTPVTRRPEKFTPSGPLLVTTVRQFTDLAENPSTTAGRRRSSIIVCAPSEPPEQARPPLMKRRQGKSPPWPHLHGACPEDPGTQPPKGKELTIEAWVRSNRKSGVVVARGGPAAGLH